MAVLTLSAIGGVSPLGAGEVADQRAQLARAAIKDLGDKLKAELTRALKESGPVAAISVCRTVAPAVAQEASSAHSLAVSRTALKVRNPANAPDAFERKVLQDFLARAAEGTDLNMLEHAETVGEGEAVEYRYMKAIPAAAEPCLTCHGSAIAPDLKAEIDRLYPQDQATGFKAGDLRGAFSVRIKAQ
jgi:hypothetical protein